MKSLALLLCSFLSLAAFGQPADTTVVYFDYNRSELTAEARQVLSRWKQPANAQVILTGHCDARGSDAYNQKLSQSRINAVRNYLTSIGFSDNAIKQQVAYGESRPVASNDSEENMALNRRVEIIRTSIVETPPPVRPRPDTTSFTQKDLETATVGQTFRLRNINFYGGRHTFLPQSQPALDELLSIMQNNPSLVIEIRGHICCRPGDTIDGEDYDAGDRRLSHNRARAVYQYLADNGIDRKRMTYRGFAGTEMLVHPELTDADRTLNRRVEVRIVKK